MTPFVLRYHDVFRSSSLVTCFPKIVIQNGGKNSVWERWETGQWHRVKNLWRWWRLTSFPHHGNRSFAATLSFQLLAANSDWLSEFDKSTAYTEQLFLLCFCKDDRQGEGHKYRSVFCIALMTLSGIPVGNDIQGGRWSTDILPGIPFLIIKSIFIHIKISYKCHEGV